MVEAGGFFDKTWGFDPDLTNKNNNFMQFLMGDIPCATGFWWYPAVLSLGMGIGIYQLFCALHRGFLIKNESH